MTRAGTAHFTISGEYLTRVARNLVLDDEPGKAYRLLADGLGGSSTAIAAAIAVLNGEAKLTGNSSTGIELESDKDGEYRKRVQWLYAGRVRHKGQWYRPTGVITAWGYSDAKHAGFRCANKSAFAKARASYYAPAGGIAELAYVPMDLADQSARERWVVFESCTEPPHWITPAHTLDQAVESALASGRSLTEHGPDPANYERPAYLAEKIIRETDLSTAEAETLKEAAYAAEDAAQAALEADVGERVRSQAGLDVFPMTLKDGTVVQIPRAPFTHWALGRLPDDVPVELPPWELVAPSGVKMPHDNRWHTDWVLGAGLDPKNSYEENVSEPAWEHAFRLQAAAIDDSEPDNA